MNCCPTCDRRHRPRRFIMPAAQLAFTWSAPRPPAPRPALPPVRLLLLHTCPDAEGQPRHGLLLPGARTPRVFPTLAAALAAKRSMEAGR